MGKGEYLGEFELVVLLALARLDDDAYGMTIRLEIEQQTRRAVSIGAVYATLRRLENKGYIASALGDPTAARGGRAKRYFTLEPVGARALQRSRAMFDRLWSGLPASPES